MELTAEQQRLHNQMVAVKERVEDELLARDNVRAIGVGLRERSGKLTDELAILIYVRVAEDMSATDRLPSEIEGFPVDVIVADFSKDTAEPHENSPQAGPDRKRYDPLLGGISMAPSRLTNSAGTLGLMVCGNNSGENAMMLSNYHVMCLKDGGYKVGDEMCQEARWDNSLGECGNCAELTRWKAGNHMLGETAYGVDAAVANRTARGFLLSEIVEVGKLAGTEDPTVGMAVQKRGRTTGLTSGVVQSVTISAKEDFGPPIGIVIMQNQMAVKGDSGAFTAGGDSGSVYVSTTSKKVVGLHWGSDPSAGHSVGNWIKAVVSALAISIPSKSDAELYVPEPALVQQGTSQPTGGQKTP
jgi:hypothetical protein